MLAYLKGIANADDYDLGETYLKASWEAERKNQALIGQYRALALEKFDAFLKHDNSHSEQWWTATLLAAEIERMLGHFDAVETRLKDVPVDQAPASLGEKGSALVTALDQVRLHARTHNAAPEMFSDVIGQRTRTAFCGQLAWALRGYYCLASLNRCLMRVLSPSM